MTADIGKEDDAPHWKEPLKIHELDMFSIYDHPLDYPDKWAVRRWIISTKGGEKSAELGLADSLEEARSLVPQGKVRVPRFAEDDPKIVEVWL